MKRPLFFLLWVWIWGECAAWMLGIALVPDTPLDTRMRTERTVSVRAVGMVRQIRRTSEGYSYLLANASVLVDEKWLSTHTLLVYTDHLTDLKIGYGIEAAGKLSPFELPGNPGQFDMRAYYRAQGIDFRLAEESREAVTRHVWILSQALAELRFALEDALLRLTAQEGGGAQAGALPDIKPSLETDSSRRNLWLSSEADSSRRNSQLSSKMDSSRLDTQPSLETDSSRRNSRLSTETEPPNILQGASPEDTGVLTAMLLGDRSFLSEEVRLDYQMASLSHLLSISGLHISLIGMAIAALMKRAGLPAWLRLILCAGLMGAYVRMTGESSSAVRALVMFCLSQGAKAAGRTYDLLSALSTAAILLLWSHPLLLFQSGFQLSFLAVLAAGGIWPVVKEWKAGGSGAETGEAGIGSMILQRWLGRHVPGHPGKMAQGKADGTVSGNAGGKAGGKDRPEILSGLGVSLVIQWVTWPVLARMNGMIVPYGIFINLAAIPLAGPVLVLGAAAAVTEWLAGSMPASAGAVSSGSMLASAGAMTSGSMLSSAGMLPASGAFYSVCHTFAQLLLIPASLILRFWRMLSRLISALPGRAWVTGSPEDGQIALYYLLLLAVILWMKTENDIRKEKELLLPVRWLCSLIKRSSRKQMRRIRRKISGYRGGQFRGFGDGTSKKASKTGDGRGEAAAGPWADTSINRYQGSLPNAAPGEDPSQIASKTRLWKGNVFLVVITILLMFILHRPPDFRETITCIDVGQGDSIFIRNRSGCCLIDAGSSDVNGISRYRILPFLRSQAVSHLDLLILTHADGDHMNGMQDLVTDSVLTIGALVLSGASAADPALAGLIAAAEAKGIPVRILQAGDSWDLGSSHFTCLYPNEEETRRFAAEDKNETSLVIRMQGEAYTALFTGDLGEAGEQELLQDSRLAPADVLKVGHHGSRYSSGSDFLAALSPDIGLISCSASNRYGHPHPDTLERLEACGCQTAATKDCGALTVTSERGTLKIYGYCNR